jgi:uncharacterized DUF497 family protein
MTAGHPRNAEAWEWDEENEAELAHHRISISEVEQVWAEGPEWARNKRHRAGDYKMVGPTFGGRVLTIVVRYTSTTKVARAITGWESTNGEKNKYL